MVAAINSTNLKSLPCLVCSFQLIIKDGVLTQPAVWQLLALSESFIVPICHFKISENTVTAQTYQIMCSFKMLPQDGIAPTYVGKVSRTEENYYSSQY